MINLKLTASSKDMMSQFSSLTFGFFLSNVFKKAFFLDLFLLTYVKTFAESKQYGLIVNFLHLAYFQSEMKTQGRHFLKSRHYTSLEGQIVQKRRKLLLLSQPICVCLEDGHQKIMSNFKMELDPVYSAEKRNEFLQKMYPGYTWLVPDPSCSILNC